MTRIATTPIKVDLARVSIPDAAAVDAARQTLAIDAAVKARDAGREKQQAAFRAKHGVDLPECFYTREGEGREEWDAWCQQRRETVRKDGGD